MSAETRNNIGIMYWTRGYLRSRKPTVNSEILKVRTSETKTLNIDDFTEALNEVAGKRRTVRSDKSMEIIFGITILRTRFGVF